MVIACFDFIRKCQLWFDSAKFLEKMNQVQVFCDDDRIRTKRCQTTHDLLLASQLVGVALRDERQVLLPLRRHSVVAFKNRLFCSSTVNFWSDFGRNRTAGPAAAAGTNFSTTTTTTTASSQQQLRSLVIEDLIKQLTALGRLLAVSAKSIAMVRYFASHLYITFRKRKYVSIEPGPADRSLDRLCIYGFKYQKRHLIERETISVGRNKRLQFCFTVSFNTLPPLEMAL